VFRGSSLAITTGFSQTATNWFIGTGGPDRVLRAYLPRLVITEEEL
jgi:hypothetical protein